MAPFFSVLTDIQISLLKRQGSLYLECIPKDGIFHKMLLKLQNGVQNENVLSPILYNYMDELIISLKKRFLWL